LVRDAAREHGVQGAILFAAHAYVGESVQNPSKYYRNNVSGSIEFLDGLLDAGVRNLVFSSSCAIYGIQKEIPIREDSSKNPLSPYAETKLFLENVLRWYGQAYRLRSVSLRYFNAAGADPDAEIGEWHAPETHLIPLAIGAAMGGDTLRVFGTDYPTPDGTAIRDYIHVTDLADAHVRALRHLLGGGGSVSLNCGTGTGHSVKQVVEAVEAISGRKVPVEYVQRREGDAPALVADARRIRESLGWEPRYSSIETIAATSWRWHSAFSDSRPEGQPARIPRS
jgi:UDP-arabinose 4-epimerase